MSMSLGDEISVSDQNPTNSPGPEPLSVPAHTPSKQVPSASPKSQKSPSGVVSVAKTDSEASPKSISAPSAAKVVPETPAHRKSPAKSPAPKTSLITSEAALGFPKQSEQNEYSKISAYARLDFENFTFFVQTLQVILGRKSNDELLNGSQHAVDVHLSSKKAISRRHAKIFYNFGTQRFEISILGRNGAFVDDLFVEKGITVPLVDGTKIQIGDIPFSFVLPSVEPKERESTSSAKPLNPSDAISLRSSLYSSSASSTPKPSDKRKIKTERSNSKHDMRALSVARRKSLAGATNEEINTLLSELGVNSIEAIDEQDPEFVDSQIRAILGDGHANASAIVDEDGLSDFMEGEEDELDKLVKKHNLEQGVDLDESLLDRDEQDIDMDLSIIDAEIESIRSLNDAQNLELLKQKEIKKRQLEEEKRNLALARNKPPSRSGPLMGKPAAPRMGRPASIQPPSSRLYGRPTASNKNIDTRLSALSAGLPTHLVPSGPGNHPLKVAQGSYGQAVNKLFNQPRVPAPELLVPIHTIAQKPLAQPTYKRSSITVSLDFKDPPVWLTKTDDVTMTPKIPKGRKDPQIKKPYKNVYTINEIPEQYRTKPTLSFPVMIINVLKYKDTSAGGLTMNEIVEGIKEVYPYYKYCPEGWQSLVSHNVRLNKIFKAVKQEESRWAIDDEYVQEKEKIRTKQQEIAAQRAKDAAIRAEELKQKQRLEMQQSFSQNIVGRDFSSPYSLPLNTNLRLSQSPIISQLNKGNGQKPKTIAELASEISRDSSNTPMYFKPQNGDKTSPSPNIKAQLAANRSQIDSASVSPGPSSGSGTPKPITQDTKKSLAYLQKELFTLYKGKKLSYNTATTTEIITKALATTIAQVNAIGSKAGVGDNALGFLVEKAPQQVSKILDIALNKSIKEKQSGLNSNSGGATPATASPQKSPEVSRVASPTIDAPLKPSYNKTAGPARPQFFSSKPPGRPGYGGKPETLARPMYHEKRPADDDQSAPNKAPRLDM